MRGGTTLHTSPSQFQLPWKAVKESTAVLTAPYVRGDYAQALRPCFESSLVERPIYVSWALTPASTFRGASVYRSATSFA